MIIVSKKLSLYFRVLMNKLVARKIKISYQPYINICSNLIFPFMHILTVKKIPEADLLKLI